MTNPKQAIAIALSEAQKAGEGSGANRVGQPPDLSRGHSRRRTP